MFFFLSVSSAQSHEQKTFLAGSIARALAVFCVDEVVIFDDDANAAHPHQHQHQQDQSQIHGHGDEYTAYSDPAHFLAHLLAYVETPPYLRRHLFPMHRNLRTAGTLPSLDMPHHLRANERCRFREGVSVPAPEGDKGPKKKGKTKERRKGEKGGSGKENGEGDGDECTYVYTGLPNLTSLPNLAIPPHTRITLQFTDEDADADHYSPVAIPVAPSTPRELTGLYWGYTVRRAGPLSSVFTECPFAGGYDLTIGTSERGVRLADAFIDDGDDNGKGNSNDSGASALAPVSFAHLLIAFGGVAGLEAAVRADPELAAVRVTPATAERAFDAWVNVLPGQGSRTIRTEEAMWIGLMGLRGLVEAQG